MYVYNYHLDPEVSSKSSSYGLIGVRSEAWEAFSEFMETLTQFFTIASELSLMLSLSRHSSAFTLAILVAVIQPLADRFLSGHLYGTSECGISSFNSQITNNSVAFIAFCNNRSLLRMAALHDISFQDEFRQDRVSNNLGNYIEKGMRHL